MHTEKIDRILHETAWARTGGSEQELACARYLAGECEKLGFHAHLEAFDVPMATIRAPSTRERVRKGECCIECTSFAHTV